MKKFRLISAVSVAVLSTSVQAMAMVVPLNTDITSTYAQSIRGTALKNCITSAYGSDGSTSKNSPTSVDIESILKNLDCSSLKPTTAIPNFNLNLNSGSKDSVSCDNGSCDDGSCDNESCDDESCDDGSCDNGSCNNNSCDNDTSKSDTSKNDSSKSETRKNETSKSETSKNETSKNDTSKNDSSKNDSSKNDTSKNDSIVNDIIKKSLANNGSSNNAIDNNASNSDKTVDKSSSVSAYAQKVVDLVNVERAKVGIAPLAINSDVMEAAQVRAKEIKSSFSHTRPDGRSFYTALDEAGASYRGAGENIAIGQKTPEQVVNDWMNSEGHRKNILNSNFKYIGVGVDGTAWTQLFTY